MAAHLSEHLAGKLTTIAGLWKSIPNEGLCRPDKCNAKGEASSKILFGLPFQSQHLPFEKEACLKLNPDISVLQVKLGDFMPSLELPLNGSWKPVVSLLQAPGSAVWRCTSRSTSTICGETQLPGKVEAFRWKLDLEAGGERCKLEVEHVETQVVAAHYFKRTRSSAPERHAPQWDSFSTSSDTLADFVAWMNEPLTMTGKKKALEVPKIISKCSCLPFR
eukprot:TRINITY_DN59043_c0_g1_i1.p1 TRINITY_DN59043_c0_g1~~TRINITY_DN59043_c0_g1_i1.p1  ORF type:complete len:220 (+),score=35.44 TRINITY_DN59043_c0_g1_i1:71-730(+)